MKSLVIINNETTQQLTDAFSLRVKKRSDKLINYFLACYFLGGFFFAFFYNTWTIAVVGGSLSVLAYYTAKIALPGSDFYQYVLSVVLGSFMAQYIYQMHGMFEMHFFAFIGSAILITYQNWKLQIPILLVIIIHHVALSYLQNTGATNVYFSQLTYSKASNFTIHLILASAIIFICGLWGYLLKRYSAIQISQTGELKKLQTETLLAVKEQAAIESNRRFNYAAQATSDAIWDRNYSEEAVFWGEGYRTLFGYAISPLTNTVNFWKSKVHPEDLISVLKITQEAKDNPGTKDWSCEYRFLKANGEYAFVKEKAVILRNDKGTVTRTIGALQDITASKQNEILLQGLNESLEKEKYYLDSLMDNMPDSIYFKDRNSKLVRVSKYMADRFDCTIDELIGKSDLDFQDEVHAKKSYKDEQDIQITRTPKIDYVEKETRKDGTEVWVSTTKMPLINSHGEVVGTFGISRDITKLKILEKQQHEAQLDKAVALGKFEIASGVMHDIGNAVVGFGSYLTRIKRLQEQENIDNLSNLASFFTSRKIALKEAIGEDKATAVINMLDGIADTQKINRQEINKSITEQLNIISNIEDILNIQRQYINGYESKERKSVNLATIINDSLSMLCNLIEKMNISISLHITDDIPLIKGDHTKIMQVMLNVLRNSIEAIDTGSSDKNISLDVYPDTDSLIVNIKDNGIGFDSLTAEQLFKKGYTTKMTGAGLGLYNCKTIVENHKGTIDITSSGKGKGTLTTLKFRI